MTGRGRGTRNATAEASARAAHANASTNEDARVAPAELNCAEEGVSVEEATTAEGQGSADDEGETSQPRKAPHASSSHEIVRLAVRWKRDPAESERQSKRDWVRRGPGSGIRDWQGLRQFADQFRQAASLPDHAPAATHLAAAASRIAAASPALEPLRFDDDLEDGIPPTSVAVAGAGRGNLSQFTALGLACSFAQWGQSTLVIAPGVHPAAKKPRLALPTVDDVVLALDQRRELPCPTCLHDAWGREGGRVDALFGQGWSALAWLVQSDLFDDFLRACGLRYQRLIWTLGATEEATLATEMIAPRSDHLVVAVRRGWADMRRLKRLLQSVPAPGAFGAGYHSGGWEAGTQRWAVWYD
ncbi:MAG: hypothetical protein ACOC0P_06505 [Planctomycetota bacterium]